MNEQNMNTSFPNNTTSPSSRDPLTLTRVTGLNASDFEVTPSDNKQPDRAALRRSTTIYNSLANICPAPANPFSSSSRSPSAPK